MEFLAVGVGQYFSLAGEEEGAIGSLGGKVAARPAKDLPHMQRCRLRSDAVGADGKGLFHGGEVGADGGHVALLLKKVGVSSMRVDEVKGEDCLN